MKYIRASYKKYSIIYNTIFFIISIGITLGLIISFSLSDDLILNIYDLFYNSVLDFNSYSTFIYPIIMYFGLFIISLTFIGVFIPFLALFIENISIGLILGICLKNIGLNGLLFAFIYFIFTKLLYIFILIYLTINIYKFVRQLILYLKNKDDNIFNLYKKLFFKTLFSIIAIIIYNLIGIFIIPKIFNLFIFLL